MRGKRRNILLSFSDNRNSVQNFGLKFSKDAVHTERRKMEKNFWQTIKHPILVLSPMAGYTESPFRRLVKEIEPSVVLISELLSCEGLRRKGVKTLRLAHFTKEEKKYFCIQLFGKSEDAFLDAIRVVEELGADGIDLNLGCPSPKVVDSGHGSALLRNPCKTAELIKKIVQEARLPISVKMRLGFYDDSDLIETAKAFENAGISSLAIHGRTAKQKFEGHAQWERIYEVKQNLKKIPVIGNGDILTVEDAVRNLKNLDGVMIGRAALRNPWIFRQCRQTFSGKKVDPIPSLKEQLQFFERHAEICTQEKNETWALTELRKHFAHFIRDIPDAAAFRERLIRVRTLSELKQIFQEMQERRLTEI